MVTLLIADDHPLYRDALKGALCMGFSDMEILESGSLNETVKVLHEHEIDLLLLDLHMPGSSDLFGLLHIQKTFPDLPIAVVSGTEDVSLISKVVGVGAVGFIPKTASAQNISDAVNAMLGGDIWVPESVRQQIEQVDEHYSELDENVASLTAA